MLLGAIAQWNFNTEESYIFQKKFAFELPATFKIDIFSVTTFMLLTNQF